MDGVALARVVLVAAYLALVPAGASSAGDGNDEGGATSVTGRVESVRPEKDGRVPVSVRPYAQMYFLYRSDPGFEDKLRVLKDALSSERSVRCTFRRFSGRILEVEWADPDESARPAIVEGRR